MKGRIFFALLMVLVVVVGGISSQAAIGPILAGPGSAGSTYYTPRVVSLQGQSTVFRNLDIVPHDVRHVGGKFSSKIIGFNKQTPVNGVSALPRGTYKFFCSIHPNMKGQLIVR
jgi:plastocyanin